MSLDNFWLQLLATAYQLWSDIRSQAKAAGITDAQLDAITTDYDRRIAERERDV